MSWWSWAIIGYVGLSVLLGAGWITLCWAIGFRTRSDQRRLIRDAERFLAGERILADLP